MNWARIESLFHRKKEIEILLGAPEVTRDVKKFRTLSLEFSQLEEPARLWLDYERLAGELSQSEKLAAEEKEPEVKAMALEEIDDLKKQLEQIEELATTHLVPKDPLDGKNIIMEIRAGTGGDEAALFASDLLRMYTRYAEIKGWKIELMDMSEGELGGVKEAVLAMSGKEVYGHLRWESGGHRVQRVPVTEAGGRIHTSAATVAVLPEAEEAEVELQDKDLRIDVFRSSGKGGQSVNTTDSAVRITHLPSGIVVQCQDERSQLKNKDKAMRVLRSRILEVEQSKRDSQRAQDRKSQVGSGDRGDRIRTYNFPQNRVTDHQINYTAYNLERVMEGQLEEIISQIRVNAQTEALKGLEEAGASLST